jgi:hypothetical protein
MPVTISPPLLLELNKNFWDAPYFQEDVVRGPYVIDYVSSDASTNNDLKIEFSHEGPLRFCLSDGETPIDAPVYIRNSGTFLFKVRVNYQILNEQANNIVFRGLVTTTEKAPTTTTTTTSDPWYELKFVPPSAIAVVENLNSTMLEIIVYLQKMTINSSGHFVVTRTLLPNDEFIVTPVGAAADYVEFKEQIRESPAGVPLTKLVFENLSFDESASYVAKFTVKLAEEYKDQIGQPIEAEVRIRKDVTPVGGGSGQSGQGNWGQDQSEDEQTDPPRVM